MCTLYHLTVHTTVSIRQMSSHRRSALGGNLMTANRYRVTWNGLQVISETWDDVLNRDGQHDEVFFRCEKKKAKSDGTVIYGGNNTIPFVSATMGDNSS